MCIFLLYGYMPWAWSVSTSLLPAEYQSELTISLLFLQVTNIVDFFIEMPFTIYQTFVVEQAHGFNKQTADFFVKDQLKKQAVNGTKATD